MKGRFYFEEGNLVKAQLVVNKVKRFDSMTNAEKAGILGIKASVFHEFGSYSSVDVIDTIRKAVELNPSEAEWYFLLGKILRRARKLVAVFDRPQQEEIVAFETACKLKKHSGYSLFCAIAYAEFAHKLFYKFFKTPAMNKQLESEIKALNQSASNHFREALRFGDLSAQSIAKVSRGFTDLRWPFKDIDKAKELALKAVEMSPTNPMTLHTLAMFYERHALDFEKALEFNTKAFQNGCFGSGMDIIKINFRLNPDYDPLPMLAELKEKYRIKSPAHLNETLIHEGTYYLIVKQDLDQALDLIMGIIKSTPDLHSLKECKPMWLHLHKPISLYDLLYHELKSSRNRSNKPIYMEALIKIKQHKPELFEKEVNERFLEDLREESARNRVIYDNRKPMGHRPSSEGNWRRGSGAPRGRNSYQNSYNENWRSHSGNNDREPVHNWGSWTERDNSRQPFNNRGNKSTRGNFQISNRNYDFSNVRSYN